jgi:hypothetical protein
MQHGKRVLQLYGGITWYTSIYISGGGNKTLWPPSRYSMHGDKGEKKSRLLPERKVKI